jgi:multidrug efflux pump subunit AcrA (membrane-fusion protein)
MNLNMAQDGVTQIEQALSIYPARIQEMESGLAAAKAGLSMAESSLARTEIRAPFDGRLKMVQVEKDQFVSPGMPVLMLANDSVLKISVNLDSRDARRWLRFTGVNPESEAAWFRGVEQVTCKILWPEDPENHYWEGTLDRVEAFDPRSRTVTVSVEIAGRDALSKDPDQLPLVDGMYCQVEIPGKELENVYRLPRWAVSFDGTVYIAKDNRLEIRQVKVLRTEGEETIVSEGLSPAMLSS